MKKLLYLFAAVTLLASCAQEEVLVDTPVAKPTAPRLIGFETFVNKSTRGTNSTELNDFYTTFNVYGWKTVNSVVSPVFENVPVSYTTQPSSEWGANAPAGWYYENIRYWDPMASAYLFSAFTPVPTGVAFDCQPDGLITIGSVNAPITVDDTNLMKTPATALAYTGFVYDYMTATSDGLTSTGVIASPVSLTFKHLQAKLNIRIQLDEDVKTKQNVAIQKIEVHNLGDIAYYDSQTTSGVSGWNLGAATADYVPAATEVQGGYSLNATTKYNNHYVLEQLIIPQNCTKYTGTDIPSLSEYQVACLYVEYTIGNETFKSFTPLANIFLDATSTEGKYSFEGGNQYTINVIVGPAPINFEAEVTPWAVEIGNDLNMN